MNLKSQFAELNWSASIATILQGCRAFVRSQRQDGMVVAKDPKAHAAFRVLVLRGRPLGIRV